MANVVFVCGKICCGKTTYSKTFCEENNAVLLSVDEITLAVFDGDLGEKHDEYVKRIKLYLLKKVVEIVRVSTGVVLDWGFWTKAEREFTRTFFLDNGIETEMHYLDVSDEQWQKNIRKRNAEVLAGKISAYYVDDGLLEKLVSLFEMPEKDEIDFLIH